MTKILITGSAGFIGYHLSKALLAENLEIVGVDNLNNYYSPALKKDRLLSLDRYIKKIDAANNYQFLNLNLSKNSDVSKLFSEHSFSMVIHLAAQAGVRYSIDNPHAYIDSNISAFMNVIEGCRNYSVPNFIYASSSSVYGKNSKQPFSEFDQVDMPISLYAATKKSNELIAHTYSHLFNLSTVGLRFFTVYGPWGRPDMAYYKFTKAILENKSIDVYNHGNLSRDFTYIDDAITGVKKIIFKALSEGESHCGELKSKILYEIYNIGSGKPVSIREFIDEIELSCGKSAVKNFIDMQLGDVESTFADISKIKKLGFSPNADIHYGISQFVEWYLDYHKKTFYSLEKLKSQYKN